MMCPCTYMCPRVPVEVRYVLQACRSLGSNSGCWACTQALWPSLHAGPVLLFRRTHTTANSSAVRTSAAVLAQHV